VTLGLRGDFWQTSDGSLTGAYLGSVLDNTIANQSYARFDPRIGAKLRLARGLALRAAGYSNFAAPGMNQMYRSFIGGSSYTTFNPALRPQTNTGVEAGIEFARAGLTLSATAYANRLKNFIDYATVQSGCAAANTYCGTGITGINGGTLSQYVNAGDATLRGFEVLGGWQGAFVGDGGLYLYRCASDLLALHHALGRGGARSRGPAIGPGARMDRHGQRQLAHDEAAGSERLGQELPPIGTPPRIRSVTMAPPSSIWARHGRCGGGWNSTPRSRM
jgi:hypothetical protein